MKKIDWTSIKNFLKKSSEPTFADFWRSIEAVEYSADGYILEKRWVVGCEGGYVTHLTNVGSEEILKIFGSNVELSALKDFSEELYKYTTSLVIN